MLCMLKSIPKSYNLAILINWSFCEPSSSWLNHPFETKKYAPFVKCFITKSPSFRGNKITTWPDRHVSRFLKKTRTSTLSPTKKKLVWWLNQPQLKKYAQVVKIGFIFPKFPEWRIKKNIWMSCHHLEDGGGGSTLSSSRPSCKWAQFLHQVGLGPSTASELCWANSMLAIANSLNSLSSTSRKTTWLVLGELYVSPNKTDIS